MRKIPSVQWLSSFDAVMRHRNMTRAAEELHLTQGAVSQHIRKLEAFLDTPLFIRQGQQLQPSAQADAYGERVAELLEELEEATLQVTESDSMRGSLTVSVPTSFGSLWLMPRLADFTNAYPEVQLHLLNRDPNYPDSADRIDIALQFMAIESSDTVPDHVFYEYLVPICSPDYAARHPCPKVPEDLCSWQLLHMDERFNQSSQNWLQQVAQVVASTELPGLRFERQSFAIQAACNGLGVAFVPEAYVERELQTGQLIKPLDIGVWSREVLVAKLPRYRVQNARSQAFKQWLLQESEPQRNLFMASNR